ncbi:hypothetical protein FB451DRAFT_1396647 [Mycena latifolia]|nr:hypothetical protein FB451DRAFT_1396647 [Mycena latifolia]
MASMKSFLALAAGVCSSAVAGAVASFPPAHMDVVIDAGEPERDCSGVIRRTLGNVYAASALRVFIH